jgi:hypothetical protein
MSISGPARKTLGRVKQRLAPGSVDDDSVPLTRRVQAMSKRLQKQQQRLRVLEQEVQESRRLHKRVAELTDVLTELLVPAMDRDDERVRRALEALDVREPDEPR